MNYRHYFTKSLFSISLITTLALSGVLSSAEENTETQMHSQVKGPKFVQDSEGTMIQTKPDGTKIIKKPDSIGVAV